MPIPHSAGVVPDNFFRELWIISSKVNPGKISKIRSYQFGPTGPRIRTKHALAERYPGYPLGAPGDPFSYPEWLPYPTPYNPKGGVFGSKTGPRNPSQVLEGPKGKARKSQYPKTHTFFSVTPLNVWARIFFWS